ncbi:MAG: hypothetical protein R3Y59_06910 [bacterium]
MKKQKFKKEHFVLSTYVDLKTYNTVVEFCEHYAISVSELIRALIVKNFKKFEKKEIEKNERL